MSSLPLSVLIVDDSAEVVDTLAMILRRDGHDVRSALSGPQALAQLKGWQPDVALLDLALPGWTASRLPTEFAPKRFALCCSLRLLATGTPKPWKRCERPGSTFTS